MAIWYHAYMCLAEQLYRHEWGTIMTRAGTVTYIIVEGLVDSSAVKAEEKTDN